jgi:hypothetical protein
MAVECPGRGWWWRELKEAKSPHASQNTQKDAENRWFPALFIFKIAEKAVFHSEVLDKIYSQDVF